MLPVPLGVRQCASPLWRTSYRDGNWENTALVAEIAVANVEKGTGVEKAQPIYVRSWRTEWIGKTPPPPHSSGHYPVPVGSECRVYLSVNKEDGGYDVLLPNGVETLKKK